MRQDRQTDKLFNVDSHCHFYCTGIENTGVDRRHEQRIEQETILNLDNAEFIIHNRGHNSTITM